MGHERSASEILRQAIELTDYLHSTKTIDQ
jgi:hypothetical protein